MWSILTMAAVVIPNLAAVVDSDDYPTWAIQENRSSAVLMDVLIDPNGRVVRCETVKTYGSDQLGREICPIMLRKRVPPIQDSTGNNIHVDLRTLLRLFLPDTEEGRAIADLGQEADVILDVMRLPSGAGRAEVDVQLLVDAAGKVTGCEAAREDTQKSLVEAACSVRDQLGVSKIIDKAGNSVRYITRRKIEFRVLPTPASPPPDSSDARPR